MTITVTILKDSVCLLSSLGESFTADNDEHALYYVACHSNDVFLSGFFGNLVLCNVLQQYVGFNAVVIFFSCDEPMYTSTQQRRSLNAFLNARMIVLSLCHALKPKSRR